MFFKSTFFNLLTNLILELTEEVEKNFFKTLASLKAKEKFYH